MQNPDLREAPQQEAWKTLADVYSPLKLNLQKANVQQLIATVNRDVVASLAGRKAMLGDTLPALEEAGITVPPALDDPKLEKQLQEAQTKADEAYTETQKLLQESVIDAPGSSESEQAAKNGASVMLVVSHYGQAQLARTMKDDAAAKKHMSEAIALVKGGQGMETDAYPLSIRTSLGLVAPPTASTGPSSRPAAPARGARPATAPAAGEPAADTTQPATTAPAPTE
jgi:hypothetical protein